jgi:hypothetical protein
MADGPPQIQNAPLNSNPMPAGMAPTAQPPQAPQQAAPPSPQQTDMAHHAILGKAVSALMSGNTTSYSVDPQSGQTVASQTKMTPGQWGRSMVLGAMLGLASASGGDAKGGSVGGFMGGFGRGGTAVAEHGEQQDALKRQQAEQQYKNQLEAQRNQREQDEAGRQNRAFQTEETHKQAMIAAENMQTVRTQQLIKSGTLEQYQREAENGKAKIQPYVDSGIQPNVQDKTWQEVQAITAANSKAVGWDWEQTGVKTVINPDGTTGYVPTFAAYDPTKTVTLSQSFIDLMKKAKIDDKFPGTTERLKAGQELKPSEFAALKAQYQKTYNDNMEMEKTKLAAGEVSARTRLADADALKAATEAAKAKRNEKSSAMLGDALDAWTTAGGDQEAFGKLDKKSQFFITTNLVKSVDSLEKQIKDALNQVSPDQERANELKEEQENYRALQRIAIPPAAKPAAGKVDNDKINKGLTAIANLPADQQKQAIQTSQTLSEDEKQEALKRIGTVPSKAENDAQDLKNQWMSQQD